MAKKDKDDAWDGIFDDPEPDDLNDLEFKNHTFDLYRLDGLKPEDIKDKKERKLYENWLKKQPTD